MPVPMNERLRIKFSNRSRKRDHPMRQQDRVIMVCFIGAKTTESAKG